jgi:hypothetical protein
MRRILFFLCIVPNFCFSKVNINKASSTVHVESGANFVVEGWIDGFAGDLVKDQGGTISGGIIFNEGSYSSAGNKIKVSGEVDFFNGASVTLGGDNVFKGKRGEVVKQLKVKGKSNRIEGILQLNDAILLQDKDTSVTFAVQGRVPCNIQLNGGEVFLEEDLHFGDDSFFTGSGIIKLNRRKLKLGAKELRCTSPLYFDGAQDIELQSRVILEDTWTFSAESTLDGGGTFLEISDGGGIVVEEGSSLLLENVVLREISDNNLRCLDSAATLSFQNVTLILDGDYSFTVGSLEVIDNLHIKGKYVFAYQSAQTSTVHTYGRIVLDKGVTFSYDPIYNSEVSNWDQARNFLAFDDDTAVLELKGATLHVTSTSMKLRKGTLRVKNKSYIVSELDGAFHMEEGLILGNNIAADDMLCEIYGGATLVVSSGALSYKNINDSSWDMINDHALLTIGSGAKLKLHQTMESDIGIVSFSGGSVLARAAGATLLAPISIGGSVSYEVCYN